MNETPRTATAPVHVYFVLDRSGSMASIQSDVIGGFNSFVEQQRAQPGRCVMTVIQFDGHDPHEVLEDARPIDQVPALDKSRFVPRGNTPLYDAMGHAIADAAIRTEKLGAAGEPCEQIVFVTFTDGLENASREYDRSKIFDLIRKRAEAGWSFIYLGANQDAYAESSRLGYAAAACRTSWQTHEGRASRFAARATRSAGSGRKCGRERRLTGATSSKATSPPTRMRLRESDSIRPEPSPSEEEPCLRA